MEDHIELRGNAALLFQILEATSGGVWDWNIPSGNAVFSSRYAIMLGYEPEEFPKNYQSWSRLVHPHDLHRVKQAHADHIVKHKDFSVEFRMREKSGDWHWIHSRGILIERDAKGKPVRMVGTHTNIQEHKLAEESLAVMSRKLLEAQEQERARIGRELHDDINQQLALLSAEIQRMKEANPITYGELRSRMDELGKRTSEISAVVQSLSHELHSSKLEYLGLVSAMKGFCKEFGEKHKVEVAFVSEGMPSTVPPEISICLFQSYAGRITERSEA